MKNSVKAKNHHNKRGIDQLRWCRKKRNHLLVTGWDTFGCLHTMTHQTTENENMSHCLLHDTGRRSSGTYQGQDRTTKSLVVRLGHAVQTISSLHSTFVVIVSHADERENSDGENPSELFACTEGLRNSHLRIKLRDGNAHLFGGREN